MCRKRRKKSEAGLAGLLVQVAVPADLMSGLRQTSPIPRMCHRTNQSSTPTSSPGPAGGQAGSLCAGGSPAGHAAQSSCSSRAGAATQNLGRAWPVQVPALLQHAEAASGSRWCITALLGRLACTSGSIPDRAAPNRLSWGAHYPAR